MKKNLFISILCVLFFAPINMIAQVDDLEEEEQDSIETTLPTPVLESGKDKMPDLYFKIKHAGVYVAKYEITYIENGKELKIEVGNQTAGFNNAYYFNSTASNIRIKAWAMTGLVWAPWGEIYDKILQPADLNKCYRNTGTILNRNWDNDCM